MLCSVVPCNSNPFLAPALLAPLVINTYCVNKAWPPLAEDIVSKALMCRCMRYIAPKNTLVPEMPQSMC